jgi:hypothetical protein
MRVLSERERAGMRRTILKVVTAVHTENGNVILEASDDQGEIEIEIPGEVTGLVAASLFSSSGIRRVSGSNVINHMQTTGYEIQTCSDPSQLIVQWDVGQMKLRFAVPVSQLERLGIDFQKYANVRAKEIPQRGH